MSAQGTVGLVGLGQMGGAMGRTLLRSGWQVVAWDVAPAALAAAVQAGAEPADGAAGVGGRAPIVLTSLPDGHVLEAVVFDAGGLADGMAPGSLLVDTSTLLPAEARRIADRLEGRRIAFLDAPVSGGVRGAEAGQLAVMVGGPTTQFERARPLLECIGNTAVLCGPTGAGQIAKACNQLVVISTHVAIAEALALAQASGLDAWGVREVLLAGYAASPVLEIQGPKMLRRDFLPGGKARYHLKDIATIAELAEGAGLELAGFRAAAVLMERLVESGGGDLDNSAVITVVERVATPRLGQESGSGAS